MKYYITKNNLLSTITPTEKVVRGMFRYFRNENCLNTCTVMEQQLCNIFFKIEVVRHDFAPNNGIHL